ncbi:DUF4158 domain-containing protein [Streptomyces sp. YKOK-I1]
MPTRAEPERSFFLDDADRDLIALRRSDGYRLGMAVQIWTVRWIGRFLGDDPLAVPWDVVKYLAVPLGIEDTSCEAVPGAARSEVSRTGGRGRMPRGRWRCSITR